MKEATVSRTLINKLKRPSLRITRHEDRRGGIPDISYFYKGVSGWIETKYTLKYPAKAITNVALNHFTAQQKLFLRNAKKLGENAFVFWRIEDDYYLFSNGFEKLGTLTCAELKMIAYRWWPKKVVDWQELFRILTLAPTINS